MKLDRFKAKFQGPFWNCAYKVSLAMIRRREGNLKGLFEFPVEFRSLKMTVVADKELQIEAHSVLTRCWRELQQYLARRPQVQAPHPLAEVDSDAPEVAQVMQDSSIETNVPPMLVMDGALTDMVAKELKKFAKQVLIENGPEVFVHTEKTRQVRIFAGESPLSSRLVLEIQPDLCPVGISTHCCSENLMTPGRSVDVAVAVCNTVSLAAAFAAGAGERLAAGQTFTEIQNWASRRGGVMGLLLLKGDLMSKRGTVPIVGG